MAQSLPFVRDVFSPNLRLADLLLQSGRDAADAERRRGDIAAQAWNNVGQTIANIPQQIQANKAQGQQQKLGALQLKAAERADSDVTALDEAFKQPDRDAILNAVPGHMRTSVMKQFQEADAAALKVKESRLKIKEANNEYLAGLGHAVATHGYDLGAAGLALQHARDTFEQAGDNEMVSQVDAIAKQIQSDPNSLPSIVDQVIGLSPKFTELRQTQQHQAATETQAAANTAENIRHNTATESAQQSAQTFTANAQKETTRHNAAMEAIGRMTAGRQDAAQQETERHNRAMEENARNAKTGRPVTSGDAGRVTELQTSLDDLKRLNDSLTGAGSTGAVSKVGAMLPNVVSEYTGWGTDAKKKQALIDRVKQVIGKALEGGVLRKEDELKYEKILPTIGDPAPVVTAKLKGLESAIAQRKDRTLESLKDAGYNVSEFEARTQQLNTDEVWERGADGKLRKKGS